MRKLLLLLPWLLLPLLAQAQYSGTGTVSLTAPAGASSIQWYNITTGSPVVISGQTGTTYAVAAAGVYFATFQLAGQSDCTDYDIVISQGSSVTLNGATNNTGGSNYQWYREGTVVAGAATATYSTTLGGTYRLEFDNGGTCFIKSDDYTVYTLTPPCNATATPTLSATSKSNSCSATTVDLTTITASNTPSSTTLAWFSSATASAATSLSSVSAVSAGTYYAAFYDGTNVCYSPTTAVTATVTTCIPPTIAITSPVNVTTTSTNPPISGTATPLASVTVTTPNGQSCVTTASAAGSWTCTSLTFTVGSQTVTAVASNTAGVSSPATANFTVVSGCPNPSVGGTASFTSTLPLCSVSNTGTVTLSGQTGSVVKWQSSTNGGSTWSDVANTTTSLTFSNAANNQQYRAVVNNGGSCADANSAPVTITTSASACTVNCVITPGVITK